MRLWLCFHVENWRHQNTKMWNWELGQGTNPGDLASKGNKWLLRFAFPTRSRETIKLDLRFQVEAIKSVYLYTDFAQLYTDLIFVYLRQAILSQKGHILYNSKRTKKWKFSQFSSGREFLYSLNPAIVTIWSPLLLCTRFDYTPSQLQIIPPFWE